MSQPNTSAQRAQDTACHHAKEPFDQGFHVVSRRAGITSDAKVVHAYLVSLYRRGQDATQRQMADEIGLTRHRVWSALRELAEAGIIRAIRRGLGRPNGYVLLAIPETAVRPVRRQASGQSGTPARARSSYPKRSEKEPGDRPKAEADASGGRRSASRCWVCPEWHPLDACPAYARRR